MNETRWSWEVSILTGKAEQTNWIDANGVLRGHSGEASRTVAKALWDLIRTVALVGADIEIQWRLPSAIVYTLAPFFTKVQYGILIMSWTTSSPWHKTSQDAAVGWGHGRFSFGFAEPNFATGHHIIAVTAFFRSKERNLQKARLAGWKSCQFLAPKITDPKFLGIPCCLSTETCPDCDCYSAEVLCRLRF